MYETHGRANYRTGRHRTVVYERLPSQACVHFLNRLPKSIKNAPTPKALKTRLKRFLVSQAFYNAGPYSLLAGPVMYRHPPPYKSSSASADSLRALATVKSLE
ncbi:hypothetical protein J6590_072037 [Homalodisca vitripennis]|nr:hypothetical protein J6590_072037 [Homalodisca vitripennis]